MAWGDKHIESAERMWQLFEEYCIFIKGKHILKHDFVGKDANEVDRRLERPLTMEGFQNYLCDKNVITDVTDYFENKQGRYADYIQVCARIRRTIRQDQIEGGMAGIYNPNITQRLNGLVEKSEANDHKEIKITVSRGNRHQTE